MNSSEIRNKFLNFFKSKKHKVVTSSPIVCKDDPSLMFVNAGMVAFKDYLLGNKRPNHNRISNTQKCLRVSGKHNDLEEVGYDTYHHTFFEMLGNWSFGDYFKEESIKWAWELLTEVYKIPSEDLYVTVFKGSKEDNLDLDKEAYDIWSKIISKDKIILCGKEENFWEMGSQGPCGPSSEIHIDLRDKTEKGKVSAIDLVNKDNPKVIELWNLVFIQYERKSDGVLVSLPKKHIDTGMGLERLCMVLQGVNSNYDTDIFSGIIKEIEKISNSKYGYNEQKDIAMRVIADHLRAICFSIADGQLPSNNGAGYVIRRILRRAVRYAYSFLEIKQPFLGDLFDVLIKKMSSDFEELATNKQLVKSVIREEELSFLRTLDQGLVMFNSLIYNSKDKLISGAKAFELYDTFGFPFDLTKIIAREKDFKVDEDGFKLELQKQRNRSKNASESFTSDWVVIAEKSHNSKFIGYDSLEAEITIIKYRKIDSKKEGVYYQLIFDQTPFYAESGGQIGDIGNIRSKNGKFTEIIDTIKEGSLILHTTKELPEFNSPKFIVSVDKLFRHAVACNHTATHLLNLSLRSILGNHIQQKGSRVSDKNFRFDFSHFEKIENSTLDKIENDINVLIEKEIVLEVETDVPTEEAFKMGAIGIFGEKYGDKVRTIKFGESYELCGGTHVNNSKELWRFKIINETAIASGIRRIEAITNYSLKDYYNHRLKDFDAINHLLNNPIDIVTTIKNLKDQSNKLKKDIQSLENERISRLKDQIETKLENISGITKYIGIVEIDPKLTRNLIFSICNNYDDILILIICHLNNSINCSCYISKSIIDRTGISSEILLKPVIKKFNGKGGGQDFYSTYSLKSSSPNEILDLCKKSFSKLF
mgnify:FL=1|tara:strand:- start:1647 stop:4268 length:2622 start_codon:yes stop_codon:yes gene_type:complete